jgi:predicted nucleic acid-binding protein
VSTSASQGPATFDQRKTYILDSSAILRYLDGEAGYERVREILNEHSQGICSVVITSLHWGELAHKLIRRHGESTQEAIMTKIASLQIKVISSDAQRAVRSARIQARLRIPYVDCFGVELAGDSPNHIFVTADFDLKPAANEVHIELLPVK